MRYYKSTINVPVGLIVITFSVQTSTQTLRHCSCILSLTNMVGVLWRGTMERLRSENDISTEAGSYSGKIW